MQLAELRGRDMAGLQVRCTIAGQLRSAVPIEIQLPVRSPRATFHLSTSSHRGLTHCILQSDHKANPDYFHVSAEGADAEHTGYAAPQLLLVRTADHHTPMLLLMASWWWPLSCRGVGRPLRSGRSSIWSAWAKIGSWPAHMPSPTSPVTCKCSPWPVPLSALRSVPETIVPSHRTACACQATIASWL